jgi:hypothetical protein
MLLVLPQISSKKLLKNYKNQNHDLFLPSHHTNCRTDNPYKHELKTRRNSNDDVVLTITEDSNTQKMYIKRY